MNKKQAIAYAQVTLDYMQSLKYDGVIDPLTLGIEMKQAFKLYSNDVIKIVADNILNTEKYIRKNNNQHNF